VQSIMSTVSGDGDQLLTARQVRARYGDICEMTLFRWVHDGRLGFPRPRYINQRRYWRLSELVAWEQTRGAHRADREQKDNAPPAAPEEKGFDLVDRIYGVLPRDLSDEQIAERHRLAQAVKLLRECGYESLDGGRTWVRR
jgi:hypothetical protein